MPQNESRRLRIALVVVGNEVLSGDTQDTNGHYLAQRLSALGHGLSLIVTIPDTLDAFREYVKPLIPKFDVIFTSGGIGPTHDDITREALADIFGVGIRPHPEAMRALEEFYGERINDNVRRMAHLPEGAELVANVRTGAPGFKIGNVYAFAGVPQIFRDMFDEVAPSLGARPFTKLELLVHIGESRFADVMREAERKFPAAQIGSYPRIGGEYRVKVIVKSEDEAQARECMEFIRAGAEEAERRESGVR
ncbi:MAG: competence/damage-inducible protein A [bacterium]|jgi:molybdenum cofactor synthesis domain-containing protein